MNVKSNKATFAKKSPTPEQLQVRKTRAHIKGVQGLMERLGFSRCKTDGIEFTFKSRTGEIDDLFVYKNILLIFEYTSGKKTTSHLSKKKIIFDLIEGNKAEFVRFAKEKFSLSKFLDEVYPEDTYNVCFVYASAVAPNDELLSSIPYLKVLHGATDMYFRALARTIEKSARIEFFKFLGLSYDDVGEASILAKNTVPTYKGFLLPEVNSGYPNGAKIVSFYADPESLMEVAYVLRRDGWRDSDHLYQRILVPSKIKQMRRYLADEKRVFVNNVIVTLPSDTKINDIDHELQNLEKKDLGAVKPVTICTPMRFDTIGIIDGQHRVFCYHEGGGTEERQISLLRKRQHLLVTGIIFPQQVSDVARRNYEAKLFLEINDKQKRVQAALKQDIEVIIRPCSSTAIAKRIIQNLAKKGPYKGVLQTHYFDPPTKIKTSSIVNYGLKPLVKFIGNDCLFKAWSNPDKEVLTKISPSESSDVLELYIEYCSNTINEFFLAVKEKYGYHNGDWDVESKSRSALLSPTAINGLINCLRIMIANEFELKLDNYKANLIDVEKFDFTSYKSSHWRQLGEAFSAQHVRYKSKE